MSSDVIVLPDSAGLDAAVPDSEVRDATTPDAPDGASYIRVLWKDEFKRERITGLSATEDSVVIATASEVSPSAPLVYLLDPEKKGGRYLTLPNVNPAGSTRIVAGLGARRGPSNRAYALVRAGNSAPHALALPGDAELFAVDFDANESASFGGLSVSSNQLVVDASTSPRLTLIETEYDSTTDLHAYVISERTHSVAGMSGPTVRYRANEAERPQAVARFGDDLFFIDQDSTSVLRPNSPNQLPEFMGDGGYSSASEIVSFVAGPGELCLADTSRSVYCIDTRPGSTGWTEVWSKDASADAVEALDVDPSGTVYFVTSRMVARGRALTVRKWARGVNKVTDVTELLGGPPELGQRVFLTWVGTQLVLNPTGFEVVAIPR